MRAVIVCGAKIKDYEFVSSYFKDDDFFIYCDSGLVHEYRFMSTADTSAELIIGDFDSHEMPDRNDVEIIKLPTVKDDTDSVYAVKEAIKRGFDSILMVGVVGDRLDHGLVNIYSLIYMYERGVKAVIVDDFSEMRLIGDKNSEVVEQKWAYFSLVAIAGEAKGVTIKNAKYEVEDVTITPSYQYATSNEPLHNTSSDKVCDKEVKAEICVKEGYLLLMKDRY